MMTLPDYLEAWAQAAWQVEPRRPEIASEQPEQPDDDGYLQISCCCASHITNSCMQARYTLLGMPTRKSS